MNMEFIKPMEWGHFSLLAPIYETFIYTLLDSFSGCCFSPSLFFNCQYEFPIQNNFIHYPLFY